MGREAYLARLVLGRSAFDAPLRDENGDLILGGQARLYDDKSYVQQWDDRGHPANLTTKHRAKSFRDAQNEVLEACGVIIRKDAASKRKQSAKIMPENHQLDMVNEENKIGLMLKCLDRFSSKILTWWVDCLSKRILVFGASHLSMLAITRVGFNEGPVKFLFGGFLPWVVAATGRLARRPEISEPIECMNYLQFSTTRTLQNGQEYLWELIEQIAFLTIELPFEFLSTLQALNFAVLPAVWRSLKTSVHSYQSVKDAAAGSSLSFQFETTLALYFLRDYLHHQIGWRIYGLLRQVTIRPPFPTKISVQAAEHDDFFDDASIVGIGRSLGTHTDRRFYGPHAFWLALPVAFPWLAFLTSNRGMEEDINKDEIKRETLTRCAMMESNEDGYQGLRSVTRARNIVSNLESLGVDVEEDFFVDVDQWALEISSLEEEELIEEIVEEIPLLSNNDDIQDESNERQDGDGIIHDDIQEEQQRRQVEWTTVTTAESMDGQTVPVVPSTPEMGIRRATSLSQTTPRPIRRLTETNGPDFDEDMEAMLVEARRERPSKSKRKDNREFRITRLSVFAADSLAWHASSVITSLLLVQVDALYLRSLAGWFTSFTGVTETRSILSVDDALTASSPFRWPNFKIFLLSLGTECLIRGVIWQLGCRSALHYGQRYSWGKF